MCIHKTIACVRINLCTNVVVGTYACLCVLRELLSNSSALAITEPRNRVMTSTSLNRIKLIRVKLCCVQYEMHLNNIIVRLRQYTHECTAIVVICDIGRARSCPGTVTSRGEGGMNSRGLVTIGAFLLPRCGDYIIMTIAIHGHNIILCASVCSHSDYPYKIHKRSCVGRGERSKRVKNLLKRHNIRRTRTQRRRR